MLPSALFALCLTADPQPATDFAALKPLAAAVAKADKVALYEGLPHPKWEADVLTSEKASKKTVDRHGWPFYAAPLGLKAADGKTLTALFADPTSFQKWGGEKLCGGFHPDYMVEWAVGTDTYRGLVCFGCHEVKLYGPKGAVVVDMSDDGLHGLEGVLKGYRTNRPAKE